MCRAKDMSKLSRLLRYMTPQVLHYTIVLQRYSQSSRAPKLWYLDLWSSAIEFLEQADLLEF